MNPKGRRQKVSTNFYTPTNSFETLSAEPSRLSDEILRFKMRNTVPLFLLSINTVIGKVLTATTEVPRYGKARQSFFDAHKK
jgi:hypothetical protein